MNRSNLIIAGAVAVVVVTAALLFGRKDEEPTAEMVSAPPGNSAEPKAPASAPTEIPTPQASASLPPPPAAKPDEALQDFDLSVIRFQADAKGRMVTNESARLNIEKLFALYSPAERQRKLDELAATLPAAAARDLADLMERYINYDAAQRQTFPPGADLSSPEEGLTVIDGMHNLRVQYFGADVANDFFGKEEKMQRELLKLMTLEKDPSLTIEEKAERAQAMYQSQMPETVQELATSRKQAEASQPKP
jgi:hypothetical protein